MKLLLVTLLLFLLAASAQALIIVVKGNEPTENRDWPAGSVEVANLKTHGFWEGPPFGGGRYVFEYRGELADLQAALDLFAKIDAPELRLVVHDGQDEGLLLQRREEPRRPGHGLVLHRLDPCQLPPPLRRGNVAIISAADPSASNPLGKPGSSRRRSTSTRRRADIDWPQVKLPPNLTVTDERAFRAGYGKADGSVCRGEVRDMVTGETVAGAAVSFEGAGTPARPTPTGSFELKNVPPGSYRIVVAVARPHLAPSWSLRSFGADTFKQYAVRLARRPA